MGWWAPTLFGGDSPLDSLSNLKDAIGVKLPRGHDRGYGDPDSWSDKARAAWAAKADRIEPWAVERVEDELATMRQGARIWLSLLSLASGRLPDAQMLPPEAVDTIRASLERTAKGFEVFCKKGDPVGAAYIAAATRVAQALGTGAVPPREEVLIALGIFAIGGEGARDAWSATVGALALAGGDVPPLPRSPWQDGFKEIIAEQLPGLADAVAAAPDTLEAAMPKLTEDAAIDVQVATAVLMGTGHPMSERLRELAFQSVLLDPWNGEDADRNAILADFTAAVTKYVEGKAWTQPNRGLMEAFARHEGGGLVNVGPGTKG